MKKKNYFLAFLALFTSGAIFAQDGLTDNHTVTVSIPAVALVDIEPAASKNISIAFLAPTEAGLPIVAESTNSSLWLNYSSIKATAAQVRTVSVKLSTLITGVDLHLVAGAASAGGGGTKGTPSASLLLSVTDQTLISGIGSAYTGDGANFGHNLTYSITPLTADYGDLVASSNATTVTYTISDN